ncbi:HXXEE domain-containing protein [Facklamia lactis]|uniref:HXXEE domain-containing protein n=1 Tax=Facklamia lactis TaxID=2749967 RepID=UPI0018CFA5DF|nr:HXXEE domain-containing protein [Facklamia lactis]MBG9979429.1 HXXEE domain-containing protein [Facklamia lactis]
MFKESLIYIIFPLLFMTHEIEEILFLPPFVKSLKATNHHQLIRKIPSINACQFTLIVLEQLIMIIMFSLYCYWKEAVSLYIALILVYIIHIAIHYGQSFMIRKTVPGLYCGTLSAIILLYFILNMKVDYGIVLRAVPLILGIGVLNLIVMHQYVGGKFRC